jgi:hypothetical protein
MELIIRGQPAGKTTEESNGLTVDENMKDPK